MNLSKNLALIFICFAFISGCSTGQKAFKNGDYYEATLQAVKNLRTNSDSEKSSALIQKSYPMALDYYRQQIDIELKSNNIDKYSTAVEHYSKLNALADEISRCPAALKVVKPVVYFTDQQKKAEQLATKEQYENAQNLIKTENIDDARNAVQRLEWVKSKDPNYPNLTNSLIFAENLATRKVVVEDLPAMSKGFNINSKVFYNRLFDDLKNQSEKKYLRFYKPKTAEEIELTPNDVVTVQFIDFTIGTLVEREKVETHKSDSIKVGTFKDAAGVEHAVLGVVEAEVTVHEREILSRGVLKISIKDFASGEIIESQKFPSEFIWQNQWASFNGDSRAVPASIIKLTKVKQTVPPSPQEMFLLFSDPVYNSASSYLKSYYRRK